MRLPGMGLTSASWIAYSTQNGVSPPISPGSNHIGASVTYNAQRISPSGFAWAAASSRAHPTSRTQSRPAAASAIHRAGLRFELMRSPFAPGGRYPRPADRRGQDAPRHDRFEGVSSHGRLFTEVGRSTSETGLRLIREHPDAVAGRLATRGPGAAVLVKELLAADATRRRLVKEAEDLKALGNRASEAIGHAKRRGEDASAEQARMREVGDRIKALDG